LDTILTLKISVFKKRVKKGRLPGMSFLLNTNWTVLLIYATLFCISLWYNKKVAWLEDKGHLDGIKALLVVGGIAYTLFLSVPIVGFEDTLLLGGSFFFALAPMVWGEVSRFIKNREDAVKIFESARPKKE
jgi:hypothetical protein